MLTEHSTPTAAMNSTLLGMCAKLNMLDTGPLATRSSAFRMLTLSGAGVHLNRVS